MAMKKIKLWEKKLGPWVKEFEKEAKKLGRPLTGKEADMIYIKWEIEEARKRLEMAKENRATARRYLHEGPLEDRKGWSDVVLEWNCTIQKIKGEIARLEKELGN